jgi:membrane-bound lytic murein transglycosylase A
VAHQPFQVRGVVRAAAVTAAAFSVYGLSAAVVYSPGYAGNEVLPWAKDAAAAPATPPATAPGEEPAASKPKPAATSNKLVITVGVPDKIMSQKSSISLIPVSFAELPGWAQDDHLSAYKAFLASCQAVIDRSNPARGAKASPRALAEMCRFAQASAGKMTKAGARLFFETHFKPKRVDQKIKEGLLTGYYEPLLHGSRTPTAEYKAPIYRRPPDLVNMVAESERGAKSASYTHMRQTSDGLKPYPTRAEIEQGALAGQGLELLYFRDNVDVYFLQVQGSGRVELPNGDKIRISYDGKNGYPYTSIGRELIDAGTFTPDNMSLKSLANWLKADRKRAEPVMWKNQSYVFFRELKGDEADSAKGALGSPLHTGRSLAIDTSYHALGLPIYVSSQELKHATGDGGFHRLMIAHDVGSAIKGPERGDIFFGSGDKAGRVAGVTKHPGNFYILEPAPLMEASGAAQTGRAP